MIHPVSIHPLSRGSFYREAQLHPNTDSDDEHEILDRSNSSTYPEGKTSPREILPLELNSSAFKITCSEKVDMGRKIEAEEIQNKLETDRKTYYFRVPQKGFPPIPSRNNEATLSNSPIGTEDTSETSDEIEETPKTSEFIVELDRGSIHIRRL